MMQHTPMFDSTANSIMAQCSECTIDEIVDRLNISLSLATGIKRMAYEFPNKATGCKALAAFTGVVFKALKYASLSTHQQARADKAVNIISSIYGWLRGDDIVKPYRLDYTARIAPTGQPMNAYWKSIITPALLHTMSNDNEHEILDLLPTDASKCLDWTCIKSTANVVKVDFRSISDGGKLTTPHATLLKTMRGCLLRDIVINEIQTIEQLMHYESPTMMVDPQSDPSEGKITMLC